MTITPKVTVEKSTLPYTGYKGKQNITFTLDQKTRKLLQDRELPLVSMYGDINCVHLFFDVCMEAQIDKVTGKATIPYMVSTDTASKAKLVFYVIDTKPRENPTSLQSFLSWERIRS